jgi:hypothetical protein
LVGFEPGQELVEVVPAETPVEGRGYAVIAVLEGD